MKKYFLHDGVNQSGPFDFEDLRVQAVTKQTPIWHEGLEQWTTVEKVEDLKDLFKTNTPPPFLVRQPPPLELNEPAEEPTQYFEMAEKPKRLKKVFFIALGITAIIATGIFIKAKNDNAAAYNTTIQSYEEKVMTVEEIEQSQPTKFLNADGKYNENFWGTKFKVHGVITNSATVATYKDAVVKITYYTKTKTEIGSKEYTIYDLFPPHSSKNFELKIDNFKDVATIGWDVISAVAQ